MNNKQKEIGKCKKCGRIDLIDDTKYRWTQGLCEKCIDEGTK